MQYKALEGNIGELKFYGDISEWWISGDDFTRTIEEMASKFVEIHIRAHCFGGDVFEGNVMFNALQRCKPKTKLFIDGVAASMMGIVMQACDEIIAAENAWVMVHCPTGYQQGNAKQMFQAYKLLTGMEKNFTKVFVARTGKPEKYVQAWFDGTDYWFSAEEALAEGLITSIGKPVVTNIVQIDKPTENDQVESVFGRFAALMSPNSKANNETPIKDQKMKKEIIAKFALAGVTETSTDDEVFAAMQKKLDESGAEAKVVKTTAIEALISGVETATQKKYEAALRTSLVAVGEASGLGVLQSMLGLNTPAVEAAAPAAAAAVPAIPQVVAMLNGNVVNAGADNRSTWAWDKWQAEDPDGVEVMMEKKEPEKFVALYHAKFGVKPVL
ncbi:head maturation protease, ClpP-related [Pedobacter sp. NJ-S-72]